jgi:hypothetical protein
MSLDIMTWLDSFFLDHVSVRAPLMTVQTPLTLAPRPEQSVLLLSAMPPSSFSPDFTSNTSNTTNQGSPTQMQWLGPILRTGLEVTKETADSESQYFIVEYL